MNGGKECEIGGDEQPAPVQVPIGWQRKVDPAGPVAYISPSGSVLTSLEQVKTYLLTDGTCKCGLECPLILHKVFNFDAAAAVKQRTADDVKADEDVTKLCIHKRKLLAVATLHKSMETHSPLSITSSGGTSSVGASQSLSQRAIRTKVHEGQLNAVGQDCKNPFKMMMAPGQRYPPPEVSASQQPEMYSGYQRQRLASGDPGPKSPYRSGYGILSPPPTTSKMYGDGSQSPCADTLGSPDGFARTSLCGFPGGGSPSSGPHLGNSRTPLSPPSVMLHGSPPGQPSCSMTGRTSTPLSPAATAKSPLINLPRGTFPSGMDIPRPQFHHKTQPPVHPGPPHPSCALQKRQLTSEQDPLGILDPIPSKTVGQAANVPNPNFQPTIHSQVPVMNVNIPPPAIVPLPSNLPLPTVKPGPAGHGGHVQRTQAGASTSVSPSPVTSPVHMAGPAHGRMEASPHRSRSSSTSSDHGSFAMPSGHQTPCAAMKVPPRSPRSAMGSPRPMPSSPSTNKTDHLHQYKDSQIMPAMTNSVCTQQHSNPMYSPTSSSPSSSTLANPSASQKGQPGLLGMPLNQILNQQNSASFPASSLLSAAAKAQLANQKHSTPSSTSAVASGGVCVAGMGAGGHPGPGNDPRSIEGHSTLNPMLPPNSSMLLNSPEGQSGRAALRDKLMAQQRDPMRKRKASSGNMPVNHDTSNNTMYNMLNKPAMGGPHMSGPSATEQLRKVGRMGPLPPNTSMAQLLQSMSCQSSNSLRPGLSPGPGGPHHYSPGGPAQNLLAQQRLRASGDPMQHCQNMEPSGGHLGHHQGQFPDIMSQRQAPSITNCGPGPGNGQMAPDCMPMGRASTNPPPLSHPGPHARPHPGPHVGPHPGPHVGPHAGPHAGPHPGPHLGPRAGPHPGPHPGPRAGPRAGPHPGAMSHPAQQTLLHSMGRTNMMMPHGGADGSCLQPLTDQVNQSSRCGMGPMQPHVPPGVNPTMSSNGGNAGVNIYQQSAHPHLQHPAYRGQQHISETPSYPENSANADAMTCLYQNYQQGMMQQSQFVEGQRPQSEGPPAGLLCPDRGPGGGPEAVDAIYRAVVDAASKGMHVTITATVSGTTQASPVPALSAMSAFTASIGDPVNLPQAVSAVLHGQEGDNRSRVLRRAPKNELGKNSLEASEGGEYFRSPGRGTPRNQWDREPHLPGLDSQNNNSWGAEEFLECSTQVRSSPCVERLAGLAPAPPCPSEGHSDHGMVLTHNKAFLEDAYRFNNCSRGTYKERLEHTPLNGTANHFNSRPYGDVLTGDDQSPGSSTSLEGPLAKDYNHYNGHLNGMAPSPSDTKSLSSEEDLRPPDSPSSEPLYRSRTFNMGELVWGLKGFPPWASKLAADEQAALQLREQAKVEPEKLKTLTHDLEALERAAKLGLKPGKLNNHLEAAIHEAMSELDKMSATRERQLKLPKSKRRKISR